MVVLAIDPGKTTGWAALNLTDLTAHAGECGDTLAVVHVLNTVRPDVVIVEAYMPFPWAAVGQSFQSVFSAEVIGVVDLWCRTNKVRLHKRMPAARKTVPAEWLKRLGFQTVCRKKPHARDAARHLVSYLIAKKMISIPTHNITRRDY